jgi:phage shock protein E
MVVLASCGSAQESSTASSAPSATDAPAAPAGVGYQALTPAAADVLLKDPPEGLVVLDVRTPEEFAAGRIAGAIDVDLQGATFDTDVAALDPKATYFVYCHSGNRSAQAVAYLQEHDFSSIYELEGGIGAWQAAGLPVVDG